MATKTEVSYTCDMTHPLGKVLEAVHHREFAVDGKSYEIDLCDKHAASFTSEIGKFVDHGREGPMPFKIGRRATGSTTTAADKERNRKIREWAKSVGLTVPARGRIPLKVVSDFEAAGSPAPALADA